MAPMHTLLLRAIELETDVLGATRRRMASVSRIAVINRKSFQREAALSGGLFHFRRDVAQRREKLQAEHAMLCGEPIGSDRNCRRRTC